MIRLWQKIIDDIDAFGENAYITITPQNDNSAYAMAIGIQGPTGLRFKINAGSENNNQLLPLSSEPIRLGSTGIYELDLQDLEGVTVNNIIIYKRLDEDTDFVISSNQPIIIDLLYYKDDNSMRGGTLV